MGLTIAAELEDYTVIEAARDKKPDTSSLDDTIKKRCSCLILLIFQISYAVHPQTMEPS
jgi:hypothetical protein